MLPGFLYAETETGTETGTGTEMGTETGTETGTEMGTGRIAQRFPFPVFSNAAVPLLQSKEGTERLRGGGKRERE